MERERQAAMSIPCVLLRGQQTPEPRNPCPGKLLEAHLQEETRQASDPRDLLPEHPVYLQKDLQAERILKLGDYLQSNNLTLS